MNAMRMRLQDILRHDMRVAPPRNPLCPRALGDAGAVSGTTLRLGITWVAYATCLALVLVSPVPCQAASPIHPEHSWVWATNAGWVNLNPTHGGVLVFDDHLEGFAWGESIGWIRLGTHTGGGSHTYANTDADNYGVNRTGSALSGYGWSTNAGWINFEPAHGGVSVDPATGVFSGYAWGESIGWIKFSGTAQNGDRYLTKIANVTAVADGDESGLPQSFRLHSNVPNPFNDQTSIRYDLPITSVVRLSVYNLVGQPVRTLVAGEIGAGTNQVVWDGRDDRGQPAATGVYMYRLTTGQQKVIRRMLLLR